MRVRILALTLALLGGFAPAGAADPGRTYEVRVGETLSHIALYTWGDPALWPAIYLANRDQIKDPSLVYPGQRLAIPDMDAKQRKALRREAMALQSR